MINKSDAKKNGLTIIDTNESLLNDKSDIIERIKAILPNVVNSDNILNIESLKDLIDISSTTANNQGYELTFAGKGFAKAKADIATDKSLKAEREQSKNFDDTENIVIRGDNIDALKILKQNYLGKIKMIYIDPPYNTKNENFVYNDNFKVSEEALIDEFGLEDDTVDYLQNIYGTRSHSGWLSFMYPRLKLARSLLTDDGVIFISIDDNEQSNLKLLCDEIFGEDNFVANFIWNHRKSKQNDIAVSLSHNSTLCYSKNNNQGIHRLKVDEDRFLNPDNDTRGKWVADPFDAPNIRPNLTYIIINPNTGEEHLPPSGRCWRFSKDQFSSALADNRIIFGKNGVGKPQYKRFLFEAQEKGQSIGTIWNDIDTSERGTDQLIILFSQKNIFSFPKPIGLLRRILEISTNRDDIILDFFAGSGTTGDAVIKLNAEDGGNRKFILVQLDEAIDESKSKPAYDFCVNNKLEPVISSITIERLNRAGEKIKKELESSKDMFDKEKTVDIGYKVFSLTEKTCIDDDGGMLTVHNADVSTLDKLYNMMTATSQILTSKIESIEKDSLYVINGAYYVLGDFTSTIEDIKNHQIYFDGYANISLEEYLNLGVFGKETVSIIY